MYQGLHPDRDVYGRLYTPTDGELYDLRRTPLAGGFFAVVWVVQADLDWLRNVLGLGGTCFLCEADRDGLPWTDCRRNASWIPTTYTNVSHAAHFPNRHALFRKVPGLGVTSVIPDVLHTKHLGVDAYFCGWGFKTIYLVSHAWHSAGQP